MNERNGGGDVLTAVCVCVPHSHCHLPMHVGRKKLRKDKTKKTQKKGKESFREYDKEPNWHFVLLTCTTFQEPYFAFPF